MKPSRLARLLVAHSCLAALAAGQPPSRFDGCTPLEWSERLARSEMRRKGDTLFFGSEPNATWNYTSGFFAQALEELGQVSADADFTRFGTRVVASFIAPDGTIRGYRAVDQNLDLITPGRVVLTLFAATRDQKYRKAAACLRGQLATQPRTYDGAFWHKRIYPDQMWLDGLYMSGPFLSRYGVIFDEPSAKDDASRQILLADRHLYDPRSGLYYHAWDSRRTQAWADPASGHSPSFWGRAIGWYAMATVDELDDQPSGSPGAGPVRNVMVRIAAGIVRWQDPATGVWWQVVDQGSRPGNYREASASCMYVYALAKAVRHGWLPGEPYRGAVMRAYAGLIQQFIRVDGAGEATLTHCCSVAGLNGSNAAGRARDGSFDYYVSEPVTDNDLKAVAAFILAGLEVQRMIGLARSTP